MIIKIKTPKVKNQNKNLYILVFKEVNGDKKKKK